MRTNIIVRLQIAAVHNWPEADTMCSMPYLVHEHRHLFYIECEKSVEHDDRDIEIIEFKTEIMKYLEDTYLEKYPGVLDLGSSSCEQLSIELLGNFHLERCSVLEDNENGSVTYK